MKVFLVSMKGVKSSFPDLEATLPPTHGPPAWGKGVGRREEREEGPRCVGSEEGVVLVRGGDDEGERPSTPAVALSDNP